MDRPDSVLPPIPAKRYFTIGEVSELCLVKPYVLRYWEQEFVQLKPMKRRGNRRYYQHHEVLLIRRIRELLYEQGFTISGARNQLAEMGVVVPVQEDGPDHPAVAAEGFDAAAVSPAYAGAMLQRPWAGSTGGDGRLATRALQASTPVIADLSWLGADLPDLQGLSPQSTAALREALLSIRDLLA
ncbi:MAG: MerR family transcriptional regulator [Aquabacterium sp.]